MRALLPQRAGCVDREGVAIHYEVYGDSDGDGGTTLLLVPPSSAEPLEHP